MTTGVKSGKKFQGRAGKTIFPDMNLLPGQAASYANKILLLSNRLSKAFLFFHSNLHPVIIKCEKSTNGFAKRKTRRHAELLELCFPKNRTDNYEIFQFHSKICEIFTALFFPDSQKT